MFMFRQSTRPDAAKKLSGKRAMRRRRFRALRLSRPGRFRAARLRWLAKRRRRFARLRVAMRTRRLLRQKLMELFSSSTGISNGPGNLDQRLWAIHETFVAKQNVTTIHPSDSLAAQFNGSTSPEESIPIEKY